MKRVITIICLILVSGVCLTTNAQFLEPSIMFKKINHNFGTINEAEGSVEYRFEFTNNGSQPLVIHDVTTTCGCTVPEWSREPIQPGAGGSILVKYSPDRPGAFRKMITVKSNAREASTNLYVVGLVNPKPKSIADQYPIRMGQIRFKSNHIAMLDVVKGVVKSDTLEFFNESESPVKVSLPEHGPHVSFRIEPEVTPGGSQGMVIAFYDAAKTETWGYQIEKVSVFFNDEPYTNNFLAVSATIGEDFSKLSKVDIANAPKAVFDSDLFNFGDLEPGKEVRHDFVLKNEGKNPLIIRDISTTCGCTASEPGTYTIPGGESTVISSTFNSTGKTGRQFHTITLILNDPEHPSIMLRVIGNVVTKK